MRQSAFAGLQPTQRRNVDIMVAIGAVVGTENRVQSSGTVKPRLNIRRGHRHSITRLVAGAAGAAVGPHALKKWSGQVDAAGDGTVRCRLACRILEKGSVGDKAHLLLLSSNADYGYEHGKHQKNREEDSAARSTRSLGMDSRLPWCHG